MKNKEENITEISIEGIVETKLDMDTWLINFIDWLESRKECFGGIVKPFEDKEDLS